MPDEDKASKTEEATAKRKEDAFKEGNFAKAEEIQVAFGLVAAFIAVLFVLTGAAEKMAIFSRHIFANLGSYKLDIEMVTLHARNIATGILFAILPVMLLSVVAAIVGGGLQSRFGLTPKVLQFKPDKINPVKGFQQKYGMQALVKFGIDLLKFVMVALVVFLGVRKVMRHEIFNTQTEPFEVLKFIWTTTLYMASLLIVAMGLLAAINYLYQRYKTAENLKMSKKEVKDEHKQSEGDPMVKNARRQMARQLVERQMFAAVPDADMVVTNPTHYAVALRYDRGQEDAPVVLAKGKNLIAEKIKKLARESGVPVIENKPVARGLYKLGKPGQPIPPQMYQVVAEVLAFVYRSHRRYFQKRERERRRAEIYS
ncbi:MAG: flagellar biosynthesis protein FlhB [Opitutales bacterium]